MITRKSPLFFWINSLHKITIFSVLSLILIGLILSFSLSYAASEKIGLTGTTFFKKHLVFTAITIFLILFFSFQTAERLKWICTTAFFFCIIAIIITLFGVEIKGSKRWIYALGFSVQPSEFLKPFYIYVFSFLFTMLEGEKMKSNSTTKFTIFILFLHFIVTFLLFLQPDFGMIITFNCLFLMLFYINTKSMKYFLAIGGILLFCGSILGFFLEHVKHRISTFLFGLENYQSKLAEDAIQSGGFFGKGFAESKLKFILPEAHNDFIFAILIEEFGFIFCVILGLIFLLLIFSNFNYIFDFKQKLLKTFSRVHYTKEKIDENAIISFIKKSQKVGGNAKYFNIYNDFLFCRNFISLTCFLIFFEFFINASVSLNLVPTKGIAMPFISYGGSSLISHGILIGILLSFSKKRYFFLM